MPAIIGCCWRRAICRNGCLAVCSGGSLGCRFRRDSRGCGSREIDPDQQRREGCLTKPDGKAVVSSLGTRVGADGTLVPSPGPSQRKNSALDSLAGYIVWGCWELKRKFRFSSCDESASHLRNQTTKTTPFFCSEDNPRFSESGNEYKAM